jgi:hypothetical protein
MGLGDEAMTGDVVTAIYSDGTSFDVGTVGDIGKAPVKPGNEIAAVSTKRQ